MSCGVDRRRSSDPVLPRLLWHRSAAIAPIQLLAWEPPCASCVALKIQKKKKKEEEEKKKKLTLKE